MSPARGVPHSVVPEILVKIEGAEIIGPERRLLTEVKLVDNLRLPDQCTLRFADQNQRLVDDARFSPGKAVEVTFKVSSQADTKQKKWTGEIVSVEPEFGRAGQFLTVRAYDRGYRLQLRRSTRNFLQVTTGDVVRKVAAEHGLSTEIDDQGVVHEYLQQVNETDWQYLWRLANMADQEVVVEDFKLHFRRAAGTDSPPVAKLQYGESLHAFRPRVTGAQQIDAVEVRGWDPKAKRAITAEATEAKTSQKIGLKREQVAAKNILGGSKQLVNHTAITSKEEATALAQHTLNHAANAYVEAEGSCSGSPQIGAGTRIKVTNCGSRFSGEYLVSKSTHVWRGTAGYQTHFQITGRSSRSLLELVKPAEHKDLAASPTVGIVTNNNDPDKNGRVKLKFPGMSDKDESAWARMVAPGAGDGKRGMVMMPQVDDEVLVAFENNDIRRPYVVGAVYGGKAKFDNKDDAKKSDDFGSKDGSFQIHSPKNRVEKFGGQSATAIGGNSETTIGADQKLEVAGKIAQSSGAETKLKAGSDFKIDAASEVDVHGVTIKIRADGNIEIKAAANVTISGTGNVEVKGAQVTVQGNAKASLRAPMVEIGGGMVKLG